MNIIYPSLVLGSGNVAKENITILIDPGHGGIDSGAISKDGIGNKFKNK